MTTKLLIANKTQTGINSFIDKPHHSLLLVGFKGMGKTAIAEYVAEKLLKIESGNLSNYPYYYLVSSEKDSIGIDAIRELKKQFNLRTPGKDSIRRVVLIEDAQNMTDEAQNSILKLIEEPPTDSVFILTTRNSHQVRSTIISRSQIINVHRPSFESSLSYFSDKGSSEADIKRNYLLSNGMPALMSRLLENSSEEPLVGMVKEAKELLTMNRLDRLARVNELAADKQSVEDRFFAIRQVVNVSLAQAIERNQPKLAKRWYKIAKDVQAAQKLAANSTNLKAVYTNLFASM